MNRLPHAKLVIRAAVVGIALGLWAPSTGHATPAGGTDTPAHLKRVNAEFLMQAMTQRGARIAFVEIPVRTSDGFTSSQRRADILRIPEADRTDAEKDFLGRSTRSNIPANSIIGYREKQYDFDLPPRLDDSALLAATLNQFVKIDPRYELVPCGSLTVIIPTTDPILKQTGTLVLMNEPADQAIEQLMMILEPLGIHYVQAVVMPVRNDGKGMYGDPRITLNLVDRPLIEICSRVAEQLGPQYTWSLLTIEGNGRNFGFSNSIR